MTVKIFRVEILCICLSIMQVEYIQEKNGNKYLIFDDSANENNKTPVEIIKEGAFGGTYFRDIYYSVNGRW